MSFIESVELAADDLSLDQRTGRWLLVNAVQQALLYEIARVQRLRQLERTLGGKE